MMTGAVVKEKLKSLYFGDDATGRRFRFCLLAVDLVTILFFLLSATQKAGPLILAVNIAIALVLTLELAARMMIARRRARFLFQFGSMIDILITASLVAPVFFQNLAFLRVVRMLRLLRSHHMLAILRREFSWFKANEQLLQSIINLTVFVFVMTAFVYVTEVGRNDGVHNYLDALYFTVSTLTTTGFGDITLQGGWGRPLSVFIMLVGVALFLRLVQMIFRPPRIDYSCPTCGLNRHEPDAVHCKHCGRLLKLPTSRTVSDRIPKHLEKQIFGQPHSN